MLNSKQQRVKGIARSLFSAAFTASVIASLPLQANPITPEAMPDDTQRALYADHKRSVSKARQLSLNCHRQPDALKKALEKKTWLADKITITITGRCNGPLLIDQHGIEIIGDDTRRGAIVLDQQSPAEAAIVIQSAAVILRDLDIAVPVDVPAVLAKANSSVTLDKVTTDAVSSTDTPLEQLIVSESSSLTLINMTGNAIRVAGNSFADFKDSNQLHTLNVSDTSSAQSSAANQFNSVQVSGNGYFLADNGTQINVLMIWSKAAVDINRKSTVAHLMMGGQTLFGAYRNSLITGPYDLWGNVVFELEHSTAENWKAVDKPHSIISGNNATVNGVLYPGWTWTGQDGR
ncbi:hypothetical protein [Photobacterium halotolerans]|uniref:hypothetical protein n=1 Tax=Photobacterium halotolerans TaxID=265726 RepID=UPI0006194F36|nr:hypothetical protein [Photobacterium halotolerans]